jgi:glycerol kinase
METTALGAAWLAGHHAGVLGGPEVFSQSWSLDRRFEPRMPPQMRARKIEGWRQAIAGTLRAAQA